MKVTFIAIEKDKTETTWELDQEKIGVSTSLTDSKTGLTLTNIKFEEDESVPAETVVGQVSVPPANGETAGNKNILLSELAKHLRFDFEDGEVISYRIKFKQGKDKRQITYP